VRSPARSGPGWFIAVEGGDGAGKSTQIDALARWLRKRGYAVVTTREPGATALGARLREVLLHDGDRESIGPRAEALLFAADRADHVERIVRPALDRGEVVLTDRHVDSSIAYQSGGRGLPADGVAAVSAFATDGLLPDLVVLLDIEPSVAWERAQARPDGPDRLEAEPAEFHARVREAFRARAAAEQSRYLVVDAGEPAGVITAIIQDRLEALLPPSPREAAEAAERSRAQRAAEEAESRDQDARRAVERTEAEREAERRRAGRDAARVDQERQRDEARQAQARRAAEERALSERRKAERQRQEEAERRAAELHEAEQRRQAEADVEHRRRVELTARQAEARAKGLAREQAARDLADRAASEARTARLVEAARRQREASDRSEPTPGDGDTAVGGQATDTESTETGVAGKPVMAAVEVTPARPLTSGPPEATVTPTTVPDNHPDADEDDYDEEDDLPHRRWHLHLGKRKS
jgi:dTMP kinase